MKQDNAAEEEGHTLPSAVQVEMPFVPASQRTANVSTTSVADDAIVVVGQARQRKRKRVKDTTKSDGGSGKTSKANNEGEKAEVESFDFASAPNILDAVPAVEESSIPRKRSKQTKGSVVLPLTKIESTHGYFLIVS